MFFSEDEDVLFVLNIDRLPSKEELNNEAPIIYSIRGGLINNQHFGKMPNNQDIGGGWNTSKARFKVETLLSSKKKRINISLGKGEALDRFNSNIIEFKKIKDIEL